MTKRTITFAGTALALAASLSMAQAGGKDYEFRPIQTEVKSGTGGDVRVRLVQKAGGTPIAAAVIFRSRLDMSPEDMGGMTGTVAPEPSGEPGVYRFKAEPTMAGKWGAKAHGQGARRERDRRRLGHRYGQGLSP